jgi:hypothetical protein
MKYIACFVSYLLIMIYKLSEPVTRKDLYSVRISPGTIAILTTSFRHFTLSFCRCGFLLAQAATTSMHILPNHLPIPRYIVHTVTRS